MADMSEITPGPWHLSGECDRDGLRSKLVYGPREGMLAIVRVEHQGRYYGDANARLIASAPDMRKELDDARNEANCCDDINLNQPLAGIIADLQKDRERLYEEKRAKDPLKAALRAYASVSKGVRCPICEGLEGCDRDHTVLERLRADLAQQPPREPYKPRGATFEEEFPAVMSMSDVMASEAIDAALPTPPVEGQ
jgi:hypothetical protein